MVCRPTTPVLALLALVASTTAQTKKTAPTDWDALVTKAQKHRRIMVRRAVAGKIAKGGEPAVQALRAYEKQHGRNTFRLELVAAFATRPIQDASTLNLLREWSKDRDFFWRAQATQALANSLDQDSVGRFLQAVSDVSHLMRIQGGRGLKKLKIHAERAASLLRDPDPRVRRQIAKCFVEEGDDQGLPELVQALSHTGEFLGYPWARIGALEAFKALRKIAGETFDYTPGAAAEKNAPAIAKFEQWARARLKDKWVAPVAIPSDASVYTGGIEVRSCRNGDLFARWTKEGELVFGLAGQVRVRLQPAAHDALVKGPIPEDASPTKTRRGKVICDFLQWSCLDRKASEKTPPERLSQETATWLLSLVQALDNSDRSDLAREVKRRLAQFQPRVAKKK